MKLKGDAGGLGTQSNGTQSGGAGDINPIASVDENPRLLIFTPQPAMEDMCWPATLTATRWGVASVMTSDLAVNLSAASPVTFYNASTCSNSSQTTQINILNGSSTVGLWMKAADPGTYTVSATPASASNFAPASTALQINADTTPGTPGGPGSIPIRMSLTGTSQAPAGDCVGYIATFFDAQGLDRGFPAAMNLALTSSDSDGGFYPSSACTGSPVPSVPVGANVSTAMFFYKTPKARLVTLTAVGGGLAGNVNVLFTPGPAASLSVDGPLAINGGQCSAYVVSVRDQFGNATKFDNQTQVPIGLTGEGVVSGSSNCSGTLTHLEIAGGFGAGIFYYVGYVAGSKTLTATAGALSGNAVVNVLNNATPPGGPGGPGGPTTPAPQNRLFVSGPASSNTSAGSCYGPLQVRVVDSGGNALPLSAIAMLTDTGSGSFYVSNTCGGNSINEIGTGSDFYFKDEKAEGTRIWANDSANALASAFKDVVVNVGAPSKVGLLASSTSFPAEECQALSVFLMDNNNNGAPASASMNVSVETFFNPYDPQAVPTGKFYSGNNCSALLPTASGKQVVGFLAGEHQKTISFKESKRGAGAWVAQAPALGSASLYFNVNAGAPTHFVLREKPSTIQEGICSGRFLLTLLDAFDNVAPAPANYSVVLTKSAGEFYSSPACGNGEVITSLPIPQGESDGEFWFLGGTPGLVTCGVEIPGVIPKLDFTIPISPILPTQVALMGLAPLSAQGPSTAFSGACLPFKVEAQKSDGSARDVASVVTATLTRDHGSFFSAAGCDPNDVVNYVAINPGSNHVPVWFKPDTAIDTHLTVSASGFGSDSYLLHVNPGAPKTLLFSGPSGTVAGACAGPFQISVEDAAHNATALPAGTQISLDGKGQGKYFTNANCTGSVVPDTYYVPSNSVAVTLYFSDTKKENLTLTASHANGSFGTASLPFSVSAEAPIAYVVDGPTTAQATVCGGPIRFKVVDMYGNSVIDPSAAQLFDLSQAGTLSILAENCPNNNFYSRATIPQGQEWSNNFSFRSAVAQNSQVTIATVAGAPRPLVGGFSLSVTAPPVPTVNSFTAVPSSIAYNGTTTLNWTASHVAGCVLNPGNSNVAASGSATFTLTASTTFTLTCDSATQTVAVTVAPPPAPIIGSFTASPSTIAFGAATTLAWSSTHATGCTINPGAIAVPASGTLARSPIANTTYTITCNSATGSTNGPSVPVIVENPVCSSPSAVVDANAVIDYYAAPTSEPGLRYEQLRNPPFSYPYPRFYNPYYAGGSGIAWANKPDTAVAVCNIMGYRTGYIKTAGGPWSTPDNNATLRFDPTYKTFNIINGASDNSFAQWIRCQQKLAQYCFDHPEWFLTPPPAPVVTEFTASPTSVKYGASTTLSWTSTNAASCKLNPGNITVPVSGSRSVPIMATTTFTMACTSPRGTGNKTATVNLTSGWVSVAKTATNKECVSFCAGIGLTNIPSPSPEKARCASGEQRPPSAIGTVTFSYGCWPNCNPGNSPDTASVGNRCYSPGQVRDNDVTDTTVGCFCS